MDKLEPITYDTMADGLRESIDYWNNWTGKTHFLEKDNSFALGYLRRVRYWLYMKDPNFEVIEGRPTPDKLPPERAIHFKGDNIPFQSEIIDANINREMGIFNLATGAGKTFIAIRLMSYHNVRTVVVVPSLALLNQWIDRLKTYTGAKIGFASAKQFHDGDIFVVTQQTLSNAFTRTSNNKKTQERYQKTKDIWYRAGMLIVDECHHASARTWKFVIRQSRAFYRYGLTATTDLRHDRADYEYYGLLGDKLEVLDYEELVEMGMAVPIKVWFHNVEYEHFDHNWEFISKDGYSVEDRYIVDNRQRNQMIIDIALDKGIRRDTQVLILFRRVPHGRNVYARMINQLKSRPDLKMFNIQLNQIALINGSVASQKREYIYKRFIDGEIKILLAQHQVIGEGWDVSNIFVIINAMGGKSEINRIQNMGRGARLHENKAFLEIHDFADQSKYTTKHAQIRAMTYSKQGAEMVNIKQTYLGHLFN